MRLIATWEELLDDTARFIPASREWERYDHRVSLPQFEQMVGRVTGRSGRMRRSI